MLAAAVRASLLAAGCVVRDYGICPTPVLQFAAAQENAAGAISISGGHMGMGWNALTLIDGTGACLDPAGGDAVLDLFHSGDFRKCDFSHQGAIEEVPGFFSRYLDRLEAQVDAAAIRQRGYTVLIDPVAGAGCPFLEDVARRFNFALVPINAEPSAYLPREPEPRPRSAAPLAAMISHVGGDIGFVLNSDVTRLSIVTEQGEPASEEYSFAVVADHVLGQRPGPVVTNTCTSRMIDDVSARHQAPLVKTRVGQAYIVARLADEDGVLGGEGSGSVVLPRFHPGFDGFLMMALILEAMATTDWTASELLKALPKYHIVKRNRPCDAHAAYHAVDTIRQRLALRADGRMDVSDGVRIDWDDGWIHVRPSQTEQMIRVISESTDRELATTRADEMRRLVERET